MTLKSIVLCSVIFVNWSCKNYKKQNTVQTKAKVIFFIDDSLVNIKNKFTIDIYNHGNIINSNTKNDSVFLELPNSDSSNNYRVVFSSGNNKVDISNVPAYVLMPKYKIDLIFGIDRIPFGDDVIFPIKDSNSYKEVKVIYYIKIDPLEQGMGRIFKAYGK
jgi:hypothetical protein